MRKTRVRALKAALGGSPTRKALQFAKRAYVAAKRHRPFFTNRDDMEKPKDRRRGVSVRRPVSQ